MFISFEGGDGTGKSTQVRNLVQSLRDLGHEVVQTREPGGSEGAEEIRALILTGDVNRWSAQTEVLLFNAARRDHMEKTVLPALERGAIVITDRFADSTRAYQGTRHPELRAFVDQIHAAAIGREPDLTIMLQMDPTEALQRGLDRLAAAASTEDRFEKMGDSFQAKLSAEFLAIAQSEEHRHRCRLVDASRSIGEIAREIKDIVTCELQKRSKCEFEIANMDLSP